jgi:predicted deacylase
MMSPIYSTVDFAKPGKQLGHLGVPYSHNLGGWANLRMPISVIARGRGPTALVMAGNHGDEYPGPIAILKLMREIQADQVTGRLILIPALNWFAVKAATRLSPWDGKNLNRCFPGKPDGTLTEQVAHYVSTVLFPLADIVVDIHTGGRSTDFLPCAHMHKVPDRVQRKQMARSPGTPISLSSTPTSPVRDCCRWKPKGRERS